MQSRREQVRAYRFVTRRVVSAMLAGDPETTDLPMRRLSMATFGSVMLATIVFAAVGAYGLLNAGGGSPDQHTLIVVRETGARYVYLEDNLLHPVLNYASARLILNSANPPVHMMSENSLRNLPRGPALGIPGAPDALPAPKSLIGPPWSLCSARQSADQADPVSQLLVGAPPAGGTGLGNAALITASGRQNGTRYVIWRNHDGNLERMKIPTQSNQVLAALGLTSPDPVAVAEAVLDGIPAGPDLAPITLPDQGKPSGRTVAGAPAAIGQVYNVDKQYYLMLDRGLVPIGDVTRRLLTGKGAQPVQATTQDVGGARLDIHFEPEGYPDAVPTPLRPGNPAPAVCATFGARTAGNQDIDLLVYDQPPEQLTNLGTGAATQISLGVRTVDRVVVPGGRGALVQALPALGSTAPGATVYLVTDQGEKFPVPGTDAQAALGYGDMHPTPVPAALLALVPTGPSLDPVAARGGTPSAGPSAGATTRSGATPSATPG